MQIGLPNGWKVVYPEDVVTEERGIVSGPFGSSIGKRFFVENGIPVIRGNNLTLGEKKFVDDGFVYLTEEKAKQFRNCQAIAGDIVFTAAGTLGQVGLIPENSRFPVYIISNKQLRIRPNPKIGLPEYLYYWFSSERIRNYIIGLNTGSSVPLITLGKLRSVPINLPPLETQRRIASILSAYDDLIENNTRRIKILEEMAQAIYREWFVEFRAPGVELRTATPEEKKLTGKGQFPKGWEVTKVEQLVKRVPSGKKYENKTVQPEGKVPVLDQGKSGIIGYHDDEPGVKASEENPVIVFANHTCYQRIIQFPFSAIQNVLPFVPTPEKFRNIYWLHWATKDLVKFNDYKGHWPEFMGKRAVCPSTELAQAFGDFAMPIVQLVFKLENKNINLRRTRDLLLPKLISGEVEIQ